MPHHRATHLLKLAALGTILFGLALVLAPHSGLAIAGLVFVDLAFLPLDGTPGLGGPVSHLMFAISGGLMVGLGVLVWQVTVLVFTDSPQLARRILLPALLAWYLPDCLGSLLSGAWFNVVMNSGFLALFLIPLLMARPVPLPRPSP